MKTRKILAIAIIAIMFLALFIGTVNAAASRTFQLLVTTKTYTVGQEGTDTSANQSVEVGKTLQLKAYVNEKNESSPGVVEGESNTEEETVTNTIVAEATPTWKSSDETVATISSTGLVTPVKAGTTTITAVGLYQTTGLATSITVTVTGSAAPEPTEPAEDWTDVSKVTFKAADITRFNTVDVTFSNFTPKDGHSYYAVITQNASYTFDETTEDWKKHSINYDKDKKAYFAYFNDSTDSMARMLTEETKDAYMVIIDKNVNKNTAKMVLNPTKIAKATLKANLGGGYIESWHYSADESDFNNNVNMAKDRKITYKIGEVTDNSILSAISNKESDGFTRLLAYAKADSNSLGNGSFNFGDYGYKTSNIAKATGKISGDKYYYVYAVADTVNGKYVPVEDVVIYNGASDGTLTHFAFAGSTTTDPYTGSTNTTNPTNTTGDNTIAIKKIPQTGATPVFMIVLGSTILVATLIFVANKKYRDIK